MKGIFRLSAVFAALSMSTGLATADDFTPGFYGSLYGGFYLPETPSATFKYGLSYYNGDIDVDNGYRFGGAIGYDFNENVSAEFEASYVHSDVNAISVDPIVIPASGDGTALLLMGNAFIGERFGSWHPYVGAGIGAAHVSLDVDFGSGLDDSDWAFAAQAFAGVDYEINQQVAIGTRYRYQHIGSTDYSDGNGLPVTVGEIGSHNIEFLLKYRFGG